MKTPDHLYLRGGLVLLAASSMMFSGEKSIPVRWPICSDERVSMSAEVAKKDTLFCPRTAFEMGDLFPGFSHPPF